MSCFTGFSTSHGVTNAGTIVQLMSKSPINTFLNVCPNTTMWRSRIVRCTNFVFETISQPFNGAQWGSDNQIQLEGPGDLLYWTYVVLHVPAIRAVIDSSERGSNYPHASVCDACDDGRSRNGCSSGPGGCCGGSSGSSDFGGSSDNTNSSDNDQNESFASDADSEQGSSGGGSCGCTRNDGLKRPYCNWVDGLGFASIANIAFSVGGVVVGSAYSHYMNMWEELAGKPGKRLQEMIGRTPFPDRAQLILDSQQDRTLYTPIPFYFTQHSTNAFPLISARDQAIQVHIQFAPLCQLIQTSGPNVSVVKCSDGQPLGPSDMRASLDTTHVYLGPEERSRFARGCFTQLITQVQYYSICGVSSAEITAPVKFTLPSLELMWVVQRSCQAAANNTFNYAGKFNKDPITRARLLVNNAVRFDREARYFRLVQPYQHHSLVPENTFIYCYCFALYPEACNNSGSFNFKDVDTELTVSLQRELVGRGMCNFMVVNRAFNVAYFNNGRMRLLFMN